MIKKIRILLIAVLAVTALSIPAVASAQFSGDANIQENLCRGAELQVDGACVPTDGQAVDTVNNILSTVINIFSLVVGVVAVIMIIVGGLKYITSGGDSGNVSGAKNTILYAIIGLVIVALAQIIVRFVLNRVATA